jgi:polysaccharide export outer membrane protein
MSPPEWALRLEKMTICKFSIANYLTRFCLTLGGSVLLAAGLHGQASQTPAENAAEIRAQNQDYLIGPGDVLAIAVTDAPEFTGKFRVDQSGYLAMSSLLHPIKAAGQTPIELSRNLVAALEEAKLYREPTVNVYVEEYHSHTVSVVGAVAKPGIYPLQRRMSVVEVVSEAGLLPSAGNRVTIIRGGLAELNEKPAADTSPQTFDLSKLMRGDDPKSNVELHDGDVVRVSTAEVIYVVGAVTKPGGFVMQDQSAGVTALQAIALAEGLTPVASGHRGVIVRRNTDGTAREHLPVDLAKIMSGKSEDVQLAANDILFIPVSGSKQSLRTMGQVAMIAVNGVAFYGLGYRVGTH